MYNTRKLKNLILNNGFINFLNCLGDFPNMSNTDMFDFTNAVFDVTSKFKNIIYQKLSEKYDNITDLREMDDLDWSYNKTHEAINNKSNLIFNGVIRGKLYDHSMEFRVPILINKSIIYDFFDEDQYIKELDDLIDSSEYHIISHIKCKKIGLLVDGLEVDSSSKIEKSINVIYQKLLGQMLKTDLKIGFIFGKSYKSKKIKRNLYSLEYLGVVHKNIDEIDMEFKELIAANDEMEKNIDASEFSKTKQFFDDILGKYYWYLDNKNLNGYDKPFFEKEEIDIPEYIIDDLHTYNLLPNMNVDPKYNNNFDNFKKDFANQIKEITLVPHCSPDERDFAFERNIKNYSQIKSAINDLGMKKGLKNTREVQGYFSTPNYTINKNNLDIINTNQIGIYFDIEVVNSIITEDFKNFPKSSPQIITVLGIVVVFLDEIYDIKHFVIDKLDQESEAGNVSNFINYLKELKDELFDTDYTIFHYSNAEHTFIKNFFEKNPFAKNDDLEYYQKMLLPNSYDLLKLIKEENICPKNTFGKGLKPIAKGFYNDSKIPHKWDNSDIDGENSMVYTKKAYESIEGKNHEYMKEVVKYNKLDCLVMFFIVYYWKYGECYDLEY